MPNGAHTKLPGRMQLGKNKEASEFLEREEQGFPGKPEVLDRLGELCIRLGDREKAISY